MKALTLSTSSNETLKYADSFAKYLACATNVIAYDERTLSDRALVEKIQAAAPDVILYIGSRWGKQPGASTLAQINAGIAPTIHFCSDAADQPWWDLLLDYHYAGSFKVQVAIDGNKEWPLALSGLTLLTPVEHSYFPAGERPHAQRNVACGYAGNPGGTGSHRRAILSDLLGTRHIDMRQRSDLPFTYDGYCEHLMNCRMSLNISYSGTEQAKQVKGRVVESALAGACLLEIKGSPTSDWFTPGEDYFEYESIEDARRLIDELKSQPDLTQAVAMSLRAKVMRDHAPSVFWGKVMERVK